MERLEGDVVLRPARPEDLPAVEALLEAALLPTAGVAEWLPRFVVAERAGRIVGVAGLEVYGADGLLRSVAVDGDWRGRGLGRALTDEVLAVATREGVRTVYLLTETAERYFPRHGFRRIARQEVSEAVQASVEFRELCPVSSTVMARSLLPAG
ncbi:MAG TPA: arsenic resistance N-acetyltransferase ArsN2 [Longimicrobiales bacterium]|nr:arsenic resistance N-acetyltransferase ArsN2 [Longimicrobiales bacterium]